MYKVYADNILIHDSVSPSKEVHLIDPSVSLVDSAAGSFSFTMTKNNVGYNDIQKFTTTIIIYKDNNIIWTGRVLTETDDFWNRRKFTCEGALAFLNDSIQPLHYYKNINSDIYFTTLLNNHNTRVPNNRKVQVGMITQHDQYDPYNYKTEYKSTFDTIKSDLFDVLGGHLRVRYNGTNPTPIIDFLEDCPNTSSQVINFGENLLDFTRNWDLSNLCTVIIPRGKQLEEENEEGDKDYTTIASVNSGSIYLQNDDAVATYGTVEKIVDFSEVDNPATLKLLGQKYLQEAQFDDMVLEVSAVDLHMLNKSIVSFELLDEVQCVSYPHGLDRRFPITQINIPLDRPESVKYTMGTKENPSMSSRSISSAKNFESQLRTGLTDILADAKRNAAQIINAATTGYVNIITENEKSQALIITDTPDLENAEKLWRFNLNGLGYSKDGGNSYDVAMTMDGTIVADFIKTGSISDGVGYNYWNLATGELRIASNTKVGTASSNQTISQIAESKANNAVSNQTQQSIFNKLTNNGQTQGIYLSNGKLYLNATYINTGTLSADYISGGTLQGVTIKSVLGNYAVTINNGKMHFQWSNYSPLSIVTHGASGTSSSVYIGYGNDINNAYHRTIDTSKGYISFENRSIVIGSQNYELIVDNSGVSIWKNGNMIAEW